MDGRRGNARRRGKKNKAPGFPCSEYCLPAFLLVQIKSLICVRAERGGGRICMHICIWKCILMCVYLECAHACAYACHPYGTRTCVCASIPFTCMHMKMHTHMHIHGRMRVHQVHVYVHMRVHKCCTRMCVYTYTPIWYAHIYAHEYEYVTYACTWTQHSERRGRRIIFSPPLLSSLASSSPLLLQEGCTLSHRFFFRGEKKRLPLRGRVGWRRRGKRREGRGGEE